MCFDSVCPWLCLAFTLCSMFYYCNLLVLVISLIGWFTLHRQWSWTTWMSGRSIESLIARWIGIARGRVSFIWSSGKALTTPLMPLAGSRPNTLHMHLTWSKLSIGNTQTSLPSKSLWSGDRYFLTYTHHTLILFLHFTHFFDNLQFTLQFK